MPYIQPEFREELEKVGSISCLSEYLASTEDKHFLGALNYLVYYIVRKRIQRKGLSYASLASTIGTLQCCILELYRRIASPYEDTKIQSNGDVNP